MGRGEKDPRAPLDTSRAPYRKGYFTRLWNPSWFHSRVPPEISVSGIFEGEPYAAPSRVKGITVSERTLASRIARLKRRAKRLKRQVWAIFLAWKDPATPFLARIIIAFAIAYAVSPIDLIPDFIPFLGQLDDLLILPLLIVWALRLIPPEVAARCRREAWRHLESGDRVTTPLAYLASAVFALVWIALVAWIVSLVV